MRLIDADVLREKLIKNIGLTNGLDRAFDETPTIERKTGKWIGQTPFVDTEECSCCGYNIVSNEMETPYCPNCGTRMVQEGEEDED